MYLYSAYAAHYICCFCSEEGAMLETLNYILSVLVVHRPSFDMYLYSAYAAHSIYVAAAWTMLCSRSVEFNYFSVT